ncbi:murein biosynthesis integral membrane protein MurJ [Pelagibacteraceae bacterium]|nr:murein biosynthesis integral membrane protein MurJ [Pelagibacteraceae bacterium]
MNIFKSSAIYSFFTLISRVFGFLRDIIFANFLGTGLLADIFYVAFRFPNTFRRIFSEGALNSSFIPIYSKLLKESENNNANIFAGNISLLLFLITSIIVIITEIFMPTFVSILAPGFAENSEKFNLLIFSSRIIFPFLVLITMCSIYSSILNAHGKFALSAALPILLNIVLSLAALSAYYFEKNIILILSVGVIIAGILQLILLAFSIKNNNIKISYLKYFYIDGIKRFSKLFIPSIFSSGLLQINILIGTIIASYQVSAVSYLYYADRIYQLPLALIGITLGITLLPNLSKIITDKFNAELFDLIEKAIIYALLLAIPASVALFVIPNIIMEILFERGSFDKLSTNSTALALKFFSLGLVAFIITKILTPIYFANENPNPPLVFALITVIINTILSILLFRAYGYVGIAIATTASSWLNVIVMYIHLHLSGLFTHSKKLLIPLIVIVSVSLFLGLLLLLFVKVYSKLVISNFFIKLSYLLFAIFSFIVLYIVLISFYKPFSYASLKKEFLKND